MSKKRIPRVARDDNALKDFATRLLSWFDTNGRHDGTLPISSMFDFEFEITGDRFDINCYNWGVGDIQVLIKWHGVWYKAKHLPLVQAAGTEGTAPNQTDRSLIRFELSVCSIHR